MIGDRGVDEHGGTGTIMQPGMSVGIRTDANNVSRLSSDNVSFFIGVVGGGSGGGEDTSSGTTIPFTLGSPGFLSPGSLLLEGPFRTRRWEAAFSRAS